MTKRELGKIYYKKAMHLYSEAFNGKNVRCDVNALWAEIEAAEEEKKIFKGDAAICYKNLREAFRWM